MSVLKIIALVIILLVVNATTVSALTLSELKAEPKIGGVEIAWKTDQEADSRVYYGKNVSDLKAKNISEKVLEHKIELKDLEQGIKYSYYAESNNGTETKREPTEFNEFTTLQEASVVQLDKLPTVLSTNRILMSGKAEPDSVVSFFVNGDRSKIEDSPQNIIDDGYSVETGTTGKFNATILLTAGTNEVLVFSKSGFRVGKATHKVEVDIDAPGISIADILSPRKDSKFFLVGKAEKGAEIKYSITKMINDSVKEPIKANISIKDINGSFNVTIDLGTGIEGKFQVIVSAKDSVGNTGKIEKTVEIDNKPPELIKANVPTEEVHFAIISISGEVSEPGAIVLVKNLNKEPIVQSGTEEVPGGTETESQVYFDPLGELIGYDDKFTADENRQFSGRIALVPGDNRLQFQVMDKAGNINAPKIETVRYTIGNSMWKIGRITTVPNEVFTDNMRAGAVPVSLMFYLHYIGPSYGEIKVSGVTVTREGQKSNNQYLSTHPSDTKFYYDKDAQEIFVYSKLSVNQYTGDVFKLPDQMNFALMASVSYAIVEPSTGIPYTQQNTEKYGYGEIDNTPVYFETAVSVEKPLKYTKWLTPRMINKTIRIIDAITKPVKTISDFAGKLSAVTVGVCAMYTFASYFMEPDYKTLYTICDRVQCPYVPPACEEFGKSFDWEKPGESPISDDTIRRYSPPELADASKTPYYRHKTTGEIAFEGQMQPGQESNYEKITEGQYYAVKKPAKAGDKVQSVSYAMGKDDYDRYVYEFDVYEQREIKGEKKWVSRRTGMQLSDSEFEKEKKNYVGTLDRGGWNPGPVFYKGATEGGRYTVSYYEPKELKEKMLGTGATIKQCPRNIPNTILISYVGKGSLTGMQSSGLKPLFNTEADVQETGVNAWCTSMTKKEFETNKPSINGISRCYTPGEPSYDETRCLDSSVRDKNPFDDIILSTRCGCITGIKGNLENYVKVMEAMQKCLKQAYIGQVRGGYCERLMAQFVCDMVFFAIEKTQKESVGYKIGENRGTMDFRNNMKDVTARLDERYQGAFLSQAGLDSKQLIKKVCIGMISMDFSTFKDMVNTMAKAPVEPVIGPLMPESRITAYDPFTGRLTIHYLFTLGMMSGGQDIEYEVRLECDPDYPGGETCPRDRPATPIYYRGYVPREGSISENTPIVDPNAIYWYNKATLTVVYNLGAESKTKRIIEPITQKGGLIAQCTIRAPPLGGIECRTLVPEGLGTFEIEKIGLSPKIALYHPKNKVALNIRLKKMGAPPENVYVYWELTKPKIGETQGETLYSTDMPRKEAYKIDVSKIGEASTVLNQYLFTFGESSAGKTIVMSGIGYVNIPLEKDKAIDIEAKELIETREEQKDILKITVSAQTVEGRNMELNCQKNGMGKEKCTATEKVTVKSVQIWVKSVNPARIYINGNKEFEASSKEERTPSFPDSEPSNPYVLKVSLYQDTNHDSMINPRQDEIMKYKDQPITSTFNLDYKTDVQDCSAKPTVEIVYPFMLGSESEAIKASETGKYTTTNMLYLLDSSSIEANILDDCNNVKKTDVSLLFNGKPVEVGTEKDSKVLVTEKEEGLTYVFSDLGKKLGNYKDGEIVKIQVKARDGTNEGSSDEIGAVVKKS